MKIVLAFWAIALYLKLAASQPFSPENLPSSGQQGTHVNTEVSKQVSTQNEASVATQAPVTIVQKTVTQQNLNTTLTKLNEKSVVKPTDVIQGQITTNIDAIKAPTIIHNLPEKSTTQNEAPVATKAQVSAKVPVPVTIVEKIVTQQNLDTKPTQQNEKSVVKRTDVTKGQIPTISDAIKAPTIIHNLPDKTTTQNEARIATQAIVSAKIPAPVKIVEKTVTQQNLNTKLTQLNEKFLVKQTDVIQGQITTISDAIEAPTNIHLLPEKSTTYNEAPVATQAQISAKVPLPVTIVEKTITQQNLNTKPTQLNEKSVVKRIDVTKGQSTTDSDVIKAPTNIHQLPEKTTTQNEAPVVTQALISAKVPLPVTIVEKTVTQLNLNTKPPQLNEKSVVKQTDVTQGQITPNSDAIKATQANIPVFQQNIIFNKEKHVKKVEPVVVQKSPENMTNNMLQHQNNAVSSTLLHPQIDKVGDKLLTKDVIKPVQETVKIIPTVAKKQKQIIATPVQSHIAQVKQLNDVNSHTPKNIPTINTESKNNVPASENNLQTLQPIQPIVVKPTTQTGVVSQTTVNSSSNFNKKHEPLQPAVLQQTLPLKKNQTQITKPTENIVIKKIDVSSPSPPQASVVSSTKVTTKEATPQTQTILKINKSDPNSIAQAADFAARAAVKAANEAIYSSASATKAAQEANEAALSARNAALTANAVIKATKAELSSKSEAVKPSPDVDSTDGSVSFSEKDANKLADIVVAAINRALQSIRIPIKVPKSISADSDHEECESEFHNEHESDSSSDLRKNRHDHQESEKSKSTKRTLVTKTSMPIPSPVFFASDINSFDRNSKLISSLTPPKKLGSMSEPMYAYSVKDVDAAFESSPDEPSESLSEKVTETDIHDCNNEYEDFESETELKERISKLYELSHSDEDSEYKYHDDSG